MSNSGLQVWLKLLHVWTCYNSIFGASKYLSHAIPRLRMLTSPPTTGSNHIDINHLRLNTNTNQTLTSRKLPDGRVTIGCRLWCLYRSSGCVFTLYDYQPVQVPRLAYAANLSWCRCKQRVSRLDNKHKHQLTCHHKYHLQGCRKIWLFEAQA